MIIMGDRLKNDTLSSKFINVICYYNVVTLMSLHDRRSAETSYKVSRTQTNRISCVSLDVGRLYFIS